MKEDLLRFVAICSNLTRTREAYAAALLCSKRRAYLKWQAKTLIDLDRFYAEMG